MSDDLVAFLRARLDEDEAVATAASDQEWGDINEQQPYVVFDVGAYRANKTMPTVGAVASVPRAEDRTHIARHDPARVLADVESKRRIVYLAVQLPSLTAKHNPFDNDRDAWAETLKQLALPYADHPDYREEWRP